MFGLPRAVWLLGWVSLFTDASSEAIYPLLPFFLTRVLGAGAVSLGVVEGAAEAVNSVLKIWSGRVADRARAKRPLVLFGYSVSSIARPFIAVTTTWTQVFAVRVLDRVGKGVRAAPRTADAPAMKMPREFTAFMLVLTLFTLGNSSDAFLLLKLTDAAGSARWVPLMWSALHVVKATVSVAGGRWSDRIGRRTVIAI